MYAVVGIWTAAESQQTEQDRGLHEQVIPLVEAHPGFVSGYWTRDPETGKGYSLVVLDSAESATSFKEMVLSPAPTRARAQIGITNDLLAVTEVLGDTGARQRSRS
jgi:hypothetical protein